MDPDGHSNDWAAFVANEQNNWNVALEAAVDDPLWHIEPVSNLMTMSEFIATRESLLDADIRLRTANRPDPSESAA